MHTLFKERSKYSHGTIDFSRDGRSRGTEGRFALTVAVILPTFFISLKTRQHVANLQN